MDSEMTICGKFRLRLPAATTKMSANIVNPGRKIALPFPSLREERSSPRLRRARDREIREDQALVALHHHAIA